MEPDGLGELGYQDRQQVVRRRPDPAGCLEPLGAELGHPGGVDATTTVSLPQVATTDTVYRLLANPNGPEYSGSGLGVGEYFLVENRQKAGLDVALPGCGLMVYHVHENQRRNATDTDRLVDVVEADGFEGLDVPDYRGGPGDAWHGVIGHTDLNSSTVPSTRLNDGAGTIAAMTATDGCAPSMLATLSGVSTLPTVPANDDFVAAQAVTGTAGATTGTNVNATKELGEPDHADEAGGASIWYRWVAPSNGRLTLSTGGSAIDTLLGLYTGSTVSTLNTIASNDDDQSLRTSRVSDQPVTSGTTYWIAIDGWSSGGAPAVGATQLAWSFVAATTPPDTSAPVLSEFDFTPKSVDVNTAPRTWWSRRG